ncbi:substrate-binding and VWA domain-containing protein [Winogradskya consettensis]|uniref:VWA domain-containing protein n=1 Tax=Winogradskya consettensis TaxID=113560 RepID=A0A919VVR0_9ACTN|nr:substrate-binding and VWA domain-containing protein [Actinoplanes consettensis]GIM80859.1 VWA domain-containing protein [Actinoplanes consettensis]
MSRNRLSYLSALLTGVLVIGGGTTYLRWGRAHCVPVAVTSSTEKAGLITQLAARFEKVSRPGGCVSVTVDGVNSGQAATALAQGWTGEAAAGHPRRPDVWLPSSSMWVTKLRALPAYAGLPAAPQPVAHSPLVIVMRREPAEALGWPDRALTWSDVLSLDKDAWSQRGHDEWGRFTYAKDDPTQSTSGLAATVATFYAAAGKTTGGFTEADTRSPEVRHAVRRVEANVVAHPPDIVDYLGQLQGSRADISAVVLQEQVAYLHNTNVAEPGQRFVAIHPSDGTLVMDHPFVTMPGISGPVREAAEDFLAYLRDQHDAFAAAGFRDTVDQAPAAVADSLGFPVDQRSSTMPLPSAAVMDAVLAQWKTLSKRANILLAVDKSGSMAVDSGIPGGGTRMEAAKKALRENLRLLNPDDQVGMWSFASDPDDLHPQLRTPAPLGATMDLDTVIRDALTPARPPYNDTALCVTIRDAQRALLDRLPPEDPANLTVNAVVVLTDGRDDYDTGQCRMSRSDRGRGAYLGDTLRKADPDQRVQVFGIAFGEADQAALKAIANGTGGVSLDATRHPEKIRTAFADIFTTLSTPS